MDKGPLQHSVGRSRRTLTAAIVVTLSLLLALNWLNWSWKLSTNAVRDQMIQMKELQGQVVHLDEVLTMSARMAATTGDISWEVRYQKFEPRLDEAIKKAVELAAEQGIRSAALSDEANLKLVEMEKRAFDLVRAGESEAARAILFSEEYARQKEIYASGISALDRALNELALAAKTDITCSDQWHQAIMASTIILIALSWTLVYRAMSASEKVLLESHCKLRAQAEELVRTNAELEHTNQQLYQEAASRQQAEARQDELHQELSGKSQRAALAELATGVLHNVGNALNSVNVATNFAVDQVAKSHMADLGRATELMQEHKANLAEFFTVHERGKLVLPYLEQLAETLRNEKSVLLECLRELDQKVEHVKQIVRAQQSQAKVSGVITEFEVAEVLEAELTAVQDNARRHEIELVRDFQFVPPVNSDKHKVMQIVGNLVRNSVRALIDSNQQAKRLTIRLSSGPENTAIVEIDDNGVGMDSETLAKVFQYGFTTKQDGHGFGLHHSVMAAKDLGGELRAESDGLGHGARFTLEFPLTPPAAKSSKGELAATT